MEFLKRWIGPTPEKRQKQEAQLTDEAIKYVESTKKIFQAAHDERRQQSPSASSEDVHQKVMADLDETIAELKAKLPPAI